MTLDNLPYWRLSSFYFFNCIALGLMLPFWGLYMHSLGYHAAEIGFVTSLLMITNIFSPPLWGWWADKTGHRLALIRWGAAASVLCFAWLLKDFGLAGMALAIIACGICWQGINAQFETTTLDYLRENSRDYSRIRLWGSVGFVCAVSGGGWLFDRVQLSLLPTLIVVALALMWGSTLTIREATKTTKIRPQTQNLWRRLRQPALITLLLGLMLAYFSHGSYYSFYSIYLEQLKHDKTTMGLLWSLAVLAELLVFALMPLLLKRFSVATILLVSACATSLRWLGIAFGADWIGILVFCQLLHGLSFSAVHACAIELLYRYFGNDYQGRCQALYYSLCVGAGQATGALVSGWLWELNPTTSFVVSASAAGIAAMLILAALYQPSLSLLRRRPGTGANEQLVRQDMN